MKIILIRHAESEANANSIPQGQKVDTPLSPLGKKQAKKVAENLKNEKIEAIYASDLKRARETAEAIAKFHNLKIIFDKRLREFNSGTLFDMKNPYGFWQDYRRKEASRLRIKRWEVKTPNGESEQDHMDRIKSFLNEIKNKHKGTIIVVAHGGTNKIFFGIIGHVPKKKIYDLRQANTAVNLIEIDDKSHIVHKINDFSHLGHDSKLVKTFEKVRDSPLRFPESVDDKGNTCWEKSRKLKKEFENQGYNVKSIVYKFRWSRQDIPKEILAIPHVDIDYHLVLTIRIHGCYLTIDPSNDSGLPKYYTWDGKTEDILTVKADKRYTFDESKILEEKQKKNFPSRLKKDLKFFKALNKFLKSQRNLS